MPNDALADAIKTFHWVFAITLKGEGSVAVEHVDGGVEWCHLTGIQANSSARSGVVDGHEEASADPGTLGVHHTDAKERGHGCVHCIASFQHDIPTVVKKKKKKND